MESAGVCLLTDPVFRRRVAHLRRESALDPDAIPSADAVLVSHVHWDHLDFPSLRRVGLETPLVVPDGADRLLRRHGFTRVTEVAPGSRVEIGGVQVLATHAEHTARRRPWGTPPLSLGFLIEGHARVYFAGDTDLFPGMADLAPVDIALLPVAGWGRKTGPGHLDAKRAAEALSLLRPRLAIPIHWGTYARIVARRSAAAQARRPAEEFQALARGLAPATQVKLLAPGENVDVEPTPHP